MKFKSNSLLILTFLFLLPIIVNAACPNKCSGHGRCIEDDVCSCKQNWFGGDCSQRRCPYTRAWVDSKVATEPHFYAECANKGSCDRETGVCNCDVGYGGSGCRRQTCPNDCSGHGTCEYIEDFTSGALTQWDEHKIMGCQCDPGYEGHDCSSKMCPKGDDPLTTTSQKKLQLLVTQTTATENPTGSIYLIYEDPYGNIWTTETFSAADCGEMQTALQKIPNHALDGVTVTYAEGSDVSVYAFSKERNAADGPLVESTATTLTDGDQTKCVITFPQKPGTTNYQKLSCKYALSDMNIVGMQPYNPLTSTDYTGCTVTEISDTEGVVPILHELETCSNRGICDGSTGQCECFTGHKGLACEIQEALF